MKVRLCLPGSFRGFEVRGPGAGWRRGSARILLAGAVSLLAWALLHWVAPPAKIPWNEAMRKASREMDWGITMASGFCREAGIEVDLSVDPNGTCLVGPRYTPLFTTLGQLEAKRTTLNPDVAALLAHLLERAGISDGDTVAVGASGSFPGLLLATLAAVEALGAHPLTVLSLGASSYGATRPDFHLLDLHRLLQSRGLVAEAPAAVSLGGEGDVGSGFEAEVLEELRGAVARAGVPLLEESDLRSSVARRMEIYGHPGAFVNIGGGEAVLGVSPLVLEVPAGLVLPSPSSRGLGLHSPVPIPIHGPGEPDQGLSLDLPPAEQRGVLFEMLARGVPVVHLLHVRGLALRHGLPWDPIPLPEPGSTPLRNGGSAGGWGFWLLTAAYLGALAALAFAGRHRPPRSP